MSSSGVLFRVTTFGESHGKGVGCIVDGVPPNLALTEEDIQPQLTRRRPGQSSITTPRSEFDKVTILSGTEFGKTLGTPVAMLVWNEDQRKRDYAETSVCPRPGHADYTYQKKYNTKASSGGGRASARETIGRVAAGALAEKWLRQEFGTEVVCWVSSVMDLDLPAEVSRRLEADPPTRAEIDALGTVFDFDDFMVDRDGAYYNPSGEPIEKPAGEPAAKRAKQEGKPLATRVPHCATAALIAARIKKLSKEGDSTGGIATTVVKRVPIALGEPCFDKAEAELAKAMMSLPATKGFEVGQGFNCARMRGSVHNDPFVGSGAAGILKCATNHAGGTLGGITTGENLVMRVAIKPASSISLEQQTAQFDGQAGVLGVKGRHDACVLPRAPPLLEGMAACTLLDLVLRQRSRVDEKLEVLPEI